MTAAYIDSSVLLRVVLRDRPMLAEWDDISQRVTSELTEVECLRTLDRLRHHGALRETELFIRRGLVYEILRAMELVEVSKGILNRASGSFHEVIGTLEAIHFSTALTWREVRSEELAMATHDKALGQACRAYGIPVIGV